MKGRGMANRKSVLETKPSEILTRPLTDNQQIWVYFIGATVIQSAIYMFDFATGIAVVNEHYKLGYPGWGTLSLLLMYLPSGVFYVIIISRPDLWEKYDGVLSSAQWFAYRTVQFFAFPIWVMYRYAKQLFWAVEALMQTDVMQREEALHTANQPSQTELYLFLQPFLQSIPQAFLQMFIMLSHYQQDKTISDMQALCVISSLFLIANKIVNYLWFESQKVTGRKEPWTPKEPFILDNDPVYKELPIKKEMMKFEEAESSTPFLQPRGLPANSSEHIMYDSNSDEQENPCNKTVTESLYSMPVPKGSAPHKPKGEFEPRSVMDLRETDEKFEKKKEFQSMPNIDQGNIYESIPEIEQRSATESMPSLQDNIEKMKNTEPAASILDSRNSDFEGQNLAKQPEPTYAKIRKLAPQTEPPNADSTKLDLQEQNLQTHPDPTYPKIQKLPPQTDSPNADLQADSTNSGLQKQNLATHPDQTNADLPSENLTSRPDSTNVDLPVRKMKIVGRENDDGLSKCIAFIWWLFFVFSRLLAIAACANFQPFAAVGILLIHYIIIEIHLLHESGFKSIYKVFIQLCLGYVFTFCFIEVRYKIKKIILFYTSFFILMTVENIILNVSWYAYSELDGFWYKFVFTLSFASLIISFMPMGIYFAILKPRKIKMLH